MTSSDAGARLVALDPARSFIVQAPAGSGKTELLIQRYLKLLSVVEQPEWISAITFTKKAAAEMRARVLDVLRKAAAGVPPEREHQRLTGQLASEAMRRDAAAGWRILDNPARLHIQTIDALAMSITSQMPWLSRFGAPPQIVEKAADLYRQAARNTLMEVAEEERSGVRGPLSVLLLHLDNDFSQAERLIADMLEKRDQWLRHTGANPDLPAVRRTLEASLANLVTRKLHAVRESIPVEALPDLLLLLDWHELPECGSSGLLQWKALTDLMLTTGGDPRKRPPCEPKARWQRVSAALFRDTGMPLRLKDLRRLPPSRFDDRQWQTMEALIDVLPKAVGQLFLVFQEQRKVDFAELSIRASEALGHLDAPSDLALSLGHRIEHFLIDEFQDTSYTQFELIEKLTAGWEPGDHRTLFLVGDPMQSIYRFREADVSLFARAARDGIGAIRLEPLTLSANFRSDPEIVDWVNATFSQVFPSQHDLERGAVAYSPSAAHRAAPASAAAPEVHAFLDDDHQAEAHRAIVLVEDALAQAEGTVAILVRARSHLSSLILTLREQQIPFQAIEIDQLGERPLVQDLMALTLALTHPADRISWLAILRAPWCGLTLSDLHSLAAADTRGLIIDLLHGKDLQLTADGRRRLQRCMPLLDKAVAESGRTSLRNLVESTWLALGGPACAPLDSDLADAAAYFDLLEGLQEPGGLADFERLRKQVTELFAQPDSRASGRLQIMTIHKAKGLEFDTVILPGLGRPPKKADNQKLLIWLEQQGEPLLAPIGGVGQDADPIYAFLSHLENQKGREENARLLYVAATRARSRLHLMGCAACTSKKGDLVSADSSSFLRLLWPVVSHHFVKLAIARQSAQHPGVSVVKAKPARQIRRLPITWNLPEPPPSVSWEREALEIAATTEPSYEWVGDTLRLAGTVLHGFLQRIASEGLEHWKTDRVASARPTMRSMLNNLGVPPLELDEAVARVEKALLQTLADRQGRWLLSQHAEAESEYAITGLIEGKVYAAAIDRTFIDEHGIRWIIDFKTSAHEGGSLDQFLENQKERYRPQLERYARLMAQRDERPIRLALYFPLLNEWREWAAPTLRRRQASLFE